MRFEGTIKTWNDDRGFGFIESTQGGQEIFVHIKSFKQRAGRPQAGQAVSFEVEVGPQGKKRAKNVEPIRSSRPTARRPAGSTAQWGTTTLFAIPAFLLLYFVVHLLWKPSPLLAVGYVGMSIFTILVYAFDKSAAERRAWRISESTLHLLAFAGGWPGALIAQQFLRHKSTKPDFRLVFWATAAFNIIAFVAICSPAGRQFMSAQ